jgi:hypothetical protein
MRDENMARGCVIRNLQKLNQRIAELEDTKAELKRVQELLRKERETFFPILHKAPYGIALIENDGKFIYINPAFTNITGYTLEDVSSGGTGFVQPHLSLNIGRKLSILGIRVDPKGVEKILCHLQKWREKADRVQANVTRRWQTRRHSF